MQLKVLVLGQNMLHYKKEKSNGETLTVTVTGRGKGNGNSGKTTFLFNKSAPELNLILFRKRLLSKYDSLAMGWVIFPIWPRHFKYHALSPLLIFFCVFIVAQQFFSEGDDSLLI